MQNQKYDGCSLTITVSGTAVTSGQLIMVGSQPGIAYEDAAVGDDVALATSGVFEVPKVTGAITLGQKLYFEPVTKKVTTAANDAGSPLVVYEEVGIAWSAVGSGAATVLVRI